MHVARCADCLARLAVEDAAPLEPAGDDPGDLPGSLTCRRGEMSAVGRTRPIAARSNGGTIACGVLVFGKSPPGVLPPDEQGEEPSSSLV